MNHKKLRRILANDIDSLSVRLEDLSGDPRMEEAARHLEAARDLVEANADERPVRARPKTRRRRDG